MVGIVLPYYGGYTLPGICPSPTLPWVHHHTPYPPLLYGHAAASSSVHGGEAVGLKKEKHHG